MKRVFLLLTLLTACVQPAPPPPIVTPPPASPPQPGSIEGVSLEPPDRPILSVTVGDTIEAALIQQQLQVEPVRVEGNTFYFYERPDLRARLEALGYEPARANPHEVTRRVVRLSLGGAAPREDVRRFGVRVINRERDYWVVTASVASLRTLVEAGYSIAAVRDPEPRPREVRVYPTSRQELERLGGLMDIFAALETREGFVVEGAAFDEQIDELRALGFRVELVPPRGEKP